MINPTLNGRHTPPPELQPPTLSSEAVPKVQGYLTMKYKRDWNSSYDMMYSVCVYICNTGLKQAYTCDQSTQCIIIHSL